MSDQYEDKELLDELMQIIPQITDVQYLKVKQLITQELIDENELHHSYALRATKKDYLANIDARIAELTKQEGKS